MANLTDADKVIRNDVGKTIASKLDDIADAIVAQGVTTIGDLSALTTSDKSSLVGAVNEVARYALDMTDTASGAIATFESEYALPLRNLEIEINAVQSGSGTPSPDNVRPITGFTGANIHVADDENPHVIDNVTPITWQSEAGTVYGGSLDVTTGVLTVDRASVTLNGSEEWYNKTGIANIFSYSDPSIKDWGGNLTAVSKIMADTLPSISQTAMVNGRYGICGFSWGHQICVRVENISSAVALKTYLTSNPLQAVYELATHVTYQLTPTQINTIVGTNNVFTDTNGDTTLEYYTKRGEQTVRIAEGVAVDVINNKNINNLTTTNKTLVGAVNEIASYTPVYGNTASGAIATFDTSLALPLQDCTIEINAVQESGFTGANITRCGKNLFNFSLTTVTSSRTIASDIFLKAGNYVCSFLVNNTTAISGFLQVRIGTTSIGGVNFGANYRGIVSKAFTLSEDSTINIFVGGASAGYNFEFSNGQIEIGTTATTYEAYNGNIYTVDFGQTVYGGSLDVTSGKLTVVNGSMGAGDYQITPIPINQINGTNNVFTNTNGDTSVVYACSLKDYIDRQ